MGETWDECRKGGKNGFYVIVLSLSWWAQAASTSESRANVSKATEDALWVLDRMIDSLTISKKHALDDDLTLSHSKRCVPILRLHTILTTFRRLRKN